MLYNVLVYAYSIIVNIVHNVIFFYFSMYNILKAVATQGQGQGRADKVYCNATGCGFDFHWGKYNN